ncbi:MAG TPA: adenylate/guanylate cyclase domain-containing protein [Rhodocyclaceae bacterium]|nr:adenylate/guanylate cyclase domain-containing protein [Rhodocyclaceae bacterium]
MSARNLCLLFADISGSSRLYEKLGDAEALRAVERCLHRMDRAAVSQKGRVVKTIGDEIMAVFDSVGEGILAAIEMEQRIDALPPVSGVKLAVRIGLHWGSALEEKDDVFGDTVNTASRLAGLAKGGQILTSAEGLAALSGHHHFDTREIDDLAVKGKDESVRVFEVIWQESADMTMKSASLAPAAPADTRLLLRHGGKELVLGADRPLVTLGRDPHCDLVIRDSRASRNHGRIERRRDKFILVDQSTNGTYVTVLGEPESSLKREESVLRSRGRISFGHSFADDSGEFVEFELLG